MTSSSKTEFDASVAESLHARVDHLYTGNHDGHDVSVVFVCGRFNGGVTSRLLDGALSAAEKCGISRDQIAIAWAPGAYELPYLAHQFATSTSVDAVIALGAVIRGDTGHYDLVAGECARGLQDVQLATGVPVIFGVLTTNTIEQALERSLPDETNKGRESLLTALEMVSLTRQISSSDED
jgi:6,7-dimethyl-8-ribityllumazine synthase